MKTILVTSIILLSSAIYAQFYTVTFRVDMNEQAVISDSISIAGDFQLAAGYSANWTPGITLMTDANNDSIYECSVILPAGTYQYKFINGIYWGQDEGVPSACAVSGNRQVVVNQNIILPIVCFASCYPCNPTSIQETEVPANVYYSEFGNKQLTIDLYSSDYNNVFACFYDINGRIVLESGLTKQHSVIDLSHFNNGVYLLTITAGHTIFTKKIIVF